MTIKIGIVGYGNLGKGVETNIKNNPDMELVAVFSRRQLAGTISGVPAVTIDHIEEYKGIIDVMILCGGSATDLDIQGPQISKHFVTVDSFDTHPRIPEYFAKMDANCKEAGTCSIISVGWDPGLFSLARLLGNCVLPNGKDYTFWGKGVSQGHSDAVRRIPGVKNAKQYTCPKQEVMDSVRAGENPEVKGNEAHTRVCYVVPEEGADLAAIETAIKTMPNYFVGYETYVNFITEEEFNRDHSGIPHGGFVFRTGESSEGVKHVFEFSLKLDSNPEFTSSVLLAFARGIHRMAAHGAKGCFTVFDIPFAWLSPKSSEELRAHLL